MNNPSSPINERRVLNRILSDSLAFHDYESLSPKHFSTSERQNIWAAIKRIMEAEGQVDALRLADEGKEDRHLLLELEEITKVSPAYDPEKKIDTLTSHKVQRELIQFAKELESRSKKTNAYDWALSKILSIEVASANEIITGKVALSGFAERLDTFKTGIQSQFPSLNKAIGGFQNGQVYVVAGRPSMGKTALMISLFSHFLDAGQNGLFVTLEMTIDEVLKRMLSAKTGLQSRYLHFEKYRSRVLEATAKLYEKDFMLSNHADDTAKIFSAANRLKAQNKLRFIVIDYLQLLSDKIEKTINENQRIAYISGRIKRIARSLDIPIIVGCQLNRRVELREDKRPLLADLRESGAIEQDADVVLGLLRPGYYDKNTSQTQTKLYLLKNRNGMAGIETRMIFKPDTTEFVEVIDA